MIYFDMRVTIAMLCTVSASTTVYADAIREFNETVVSTSLVEEDKSKTPAFTNVVYGEDIMANGYNDLADVLASLANVHNQTSGSGRDGIKIRGLDTQYTLLLVDGMRVSSTGALWRGGDFDYSSLPLNSIERVEIIRGPAAAIYGSDAIGGVVNIITKKTSRNWNTSVYTAYRRTKSDGGKSRIGLGLSAQGAITDHLGASFSIEKTDRDSWTDPKRPQSVVDSIEEKNTLNVHTKLDWKVNDSNSLVFSLAHNNDERPKTIFASNGAYLKQKIERNSIDVKYDGDFRWGKTTFISKYEKAKIQDSNSRYTDPKQRNLYEMNAYNKAYVTKNLSSLQILLAGIELRNQTVKDEATYNGVKGESKEVAVFAQDSIAFTPKLSVLFGGRYDHSKQFGNYFSPKLYTVYNATDTLKFKAGASRAFKAPRPHQSTKGYSIISCGGRCFLFADPDLKPETSDNYELGLDYATDRLSLNTALFYTKMKNQISPPYDPVLRRRIWVNLNKSEISGLEFDTKWLVTDKFDMNTSFTLLFKAETIDGEGKKSTLISTPKRVAKLGLGYRPFNMWKTGLDVHYVGQQNQFRTNKVLSSYKTLSWNNNLDFSNGINISAGVDNLTDVSLYDVDNNYTDNILGRNIYLNVQYDF